MIKQIKYSITKEVNFSAGHHLNKVEEGHQCGRKHGHNYKVFVTLQSLRLNEAGFVLDFGLVKQLIRNRYDHLYLNEVMDTEPTAENLAREIVELINEAIFRLGEEGNVSVTRVEVRETESSVAVAEVVESE